MSPRGFIAAVAAAISLSTSFAVPSFAEANTQTLHVYVPGSFDGCIGSSPLTTPAAHMLLDVTRPSAFLPNAINRLIGVGGPVVSAELVSLKPQTVVYTIDPKFLWSDGTPFSLDVLLQTIAFGKMSNAAWADGFHHILSTQSGPKLKTLRVVFDGHYSDWALLFRNLETGSASNLRNLELGYGCSFEKIANRPSLGPYAIISLTRHVAVLQANTQWPNYSQMYRTIIVEAGSEASSIGATPFVDLRYQFTSMDLTASSTYVDRSAKIGVSNQLATLLFSPRRPLTQSLLVRKYVSAATDRQQLINRFVGQQTFAVAPAASNLIGQSQVGYTGGSGLSPVTQMTIPDSSNKPFLATSDCPQCATKMLGVGLGLSRSGTVASFNGAPIRLRLAVGNSPGMFALATLIQAQWRDAGIASFLAVYPSGVAAANAVAYGAADVALVSQLMNGVGSVATSWYGPRRFNQLDAGWRSVAGNAAAVEAESKFNPVDALASWRALDSEIATNFWARPLFSTPYYARWSSEVVGVVPSNSIDGFFCQMTLWSST
jgi:ABC-type transport system substrate-binding protein